MFDRTISIILLSKPASHGRLHLTYNCDLETYPNTGFPRIGACAIIEDKTNIPPVAFPVLFSGRIAIYNIGFCGGRKT